MNTIRNTYLVVSIPLIVFLGYHYYDSKFNKKVIYADRSKEELIDHFNEICLGTEYGASKKVIRKWVGHIKLYIVKDDTYEPQVAFINKVVNDINKLVSKEIEISITEDSVGAHIFLFLCPDKKLKFLSGIRSDVFRNVNEDYFGFFGYRFVDNMIYNTSIFINTSKPVELQKTAIIEEITQSLGLANDSDLYPESVFSQDKYDRQAVILDFSELDKKLIQILYNPKMKTGYNRLETDRVIREMIDLNEI